MLKYEFIEATYRIFGIVHAYLYCASLTLLVAINILCTYHCHTPPIPGQVRVKIIGDLQESFDKFPTPGNFMLQIPNDKCIIAA